MIRCIQNFLKVVLLSLLLNGSMDGMQSKTCQENCALHQDDQTQADRNSLLTTQTRINKPEQPDDSLLGSLGNSMGPSLSTLLAADAKEYKEKKNKKAHKIEADKVLKFFVTNKQSHQYLKLDRFCILPKVLQQKILGEYYQKTVTYVLHHKRELAPLVYIGQELDDAYDILKTIDTNIVQSKKELEDALKEISQYNLSNPGNRQDQIGILVFASMNSSNRTFQDTIISTATEPVNNYTVEHGGILIAAYNDRTYNIYLNKKQLKNLMDTYSFEQISFFVFLAKIKVTNPHAVETISLSSKDCALFKNLDSAMQRRLRYLYPWIDFYTPNDCVLSIDDRIQWVYHKLMANVSYFLRLVAMDKRFALFL